MMSTIETRATLYSTALQRCLDAFHQLDEDDWRMGHRGDRWTARGYLAHLVTNQEAEINIVTAQNLAGQEVDIPGLRSRTDIDSFNESHVAEVRSVSTQELLNRLQAAFQAHIDMLKGLKEEDLPKPARNPGLGHPATIGQLFGMGYLHLPLHYQHIRWFVHKRRRLPHWMELASPEETHEALSQSFDLMPLFYWPERGGDLRATYLFDLEGEGGGQWTVQIAEGECRSAEGLLHHDDIRFTTRPAHWLDIQTKELTPPRALLTRRLRIKGDLRLALKLDRLLQIS